jgi:SAM-dependent methyltransferase
MQINVKDEYSEWSSGLDSEIEFWDNWFKTGGSLWPDDFTARFNFQTPFNGYVGHHLNFETSEYTVLDVGSGPITNLGYVHQGRRVEITAVDPLADEYNQIIDNYGLTPPIRTIKGMAENLSDVLPGRKFSVVHSCNALDHSADPIIGIGEMMKLCAPNGTIIITVFRREGIEENYSGLHQWNFDEHEKKVIIFSKNRIRYLDEIAPNYKFEMIFPKDAKPTIAILIKNPTL